MFLPKCGSMFYRYSLNLRNWKRAWSVVEIVYHTIQREKLIDAPWKAKFSVSGRKAPTPFKCTATVRCCPQVPLSTYLTFGGTVAMFSKNRNRKTTSLLQLRTHDPNPALSHPSPSQFYECLNLSYIHS